MAERNILMMRRRRRRRRRKRRKQTKMRRQWDFSDDSLLYSFVVVQLPKKNQNKLQSLLNLKSPKLLLRSRFIRLNQKQNSCLKIYYHQTPVSIAISRDLCFKICWFVRLFFHDPFHSPKVAVTWLNISTPWQWPFKKKILLIIC